MWRTWGGKAHVLREYETDPPTEMRRQGQRARTATQSVQTRERHPTAAVVGKKYGGSVLKTNLRGERRHQDASELQDTDIYTKEYKDIYIYIF